MKSADRSDFSNAARQLDAACRLMADGRRAARRLAAWAGQFGLSEAELRLLWCLRKTGQIYDSTGAAPGSISKSTTSPNQTRLAAELAVSVSQISVLVERLQQRGWILGAAAPDDRRRQHWSLTLNGNALLDQVVSSVVSADDQTTCPSKKGLDGQNEEAA